MPSSSNGDIIASVVMMKNVKAVAVAVQTLQQWFLISMLLLCNFLHNFCHEIVFVIGVLNVVLDIVNVVV